MNDKQADGERMSWKGNVDEEGGKTLRSAELLQKNVIGALHKCKWQDSCGSLCFILISLSLPDLSHIPQKSFKARSKKKPQCVMASFTNLRNLHPPSLYRSWVRSRSPAGTPGMEGPDKESAFLSTDVCVLLC